MRNTNNGQTSDFTDFVRAVTRNRDTTWRGLTVFLLSIVILACAVEIRKSYPDSFAHPV